jgi:hypothetical protein
MGQLERRGSVAGDGAPSSEADLCETKAPGRPVHGIMARVVLATKHRSWLRSER